MALIKRSSETAIGGEQASSGAAGEGGTTRKLARSGGALAAATCWAPPSTILAQPCRSSAPALDQHREALRSAMVNMTQALPNRFDARSRKRLWGTKLV